VDDAGQVTLELRTPFAYLKMLVDDIRHVNTRPENTVTRRRKAGKNAGTMIVSGVFPNNVRVTTSLSPQVGVTPMRGSGSPR